ncbi:MAG: hypothetical protein WBA10_15760 [Elainellaceae cyanobacterium]
MGLGGFEEDDELGLGNEALEGAGVGVGVVALAEAGDGDALSFWEKADDAPGGELGSVVRHGFCGLSLRR